jgi:hypothetical protein
MEKLSPPVRIFALVAALAAVGGLLFTFTMGRGSATETAPLSPTPPVSPNAVAPTAKARVTAKKAAAKPSTARTTRSAPKRAATPKPATASKPAPKTPLAPPTGFPAQVDAALRDHEVVVVSLVVPGAHVDELAAAEARAGAQGAKVGYLALNVLNEQVARALLTKLGSLEDPTLLVLKRPDEVVLKLAGFVDRETVAQAAANASS